MEGIANELTTDIYYFNRMSMFLRESYGIQERIGALAKIIKRLDEVYEKIIDSLNLFDENYSKNYIGDGNESSKNNVYLDRIGNIFNVSRSFSIKMGTKETPTSIEDITDSAPTYITLNNKEFLQYLKLQIIKQNFTGTREELALLYGDDTTELENTGTSQLNFIYLTDIKASTKVDIYWQTKNKNKEYSSEFYYMFLNGLLTIESMGIEYNRTIMNIDSIAVFDDKDKDELGNYKSGFYDPDSTSPERAMFG